MAVSKFCKFLNTLNNFPQFNLLKNFQYNCTEELKLFQKNNMINCQMFDTYYNFAIGGMGSYSIVMEVR